MITALFYAVSGWFESLSIALSCLQRFGRYILDCTKWPTDVTQLLSYGDSNMTELIKHFTPLLERNLCII
jgi:hypothetical protein